MSTRPTTRWATVSSICGSRASADVVHDVRARIDRGSRHERAPRVDADSGVRPRTQQPVDHRHDPMEFLVHATVVGARARGLAADVDDVGAIVDKPDAVRHGMLRVGEQAAVAERVRRHVHDAHHERARPSGRSRVAAAPGSTRSRLHRSEALVKREGRYGIPMWCIASWRVRASLRNKPRTADVTVTAPGFLMPRIVMHRCSASITTNTPRGLSARLDRLGDLGRQALLHLRALRQRVHDARDLR